MAIARFPTTVLDCADPGVLAEFYGTMLGWKVDVQDDWVDVRSEDVNDYLKDRAGASVSARPSARGTGP